MEKKKNTIKKLTPEEIKEMRLKLTALAISNRIGKAKWEQKRESPKEE